MHPRPVGIPAIFNLPAFLIVGWLTIALVRGVKESAHLTTITTLVKIAVGLFFCFVGVFCVNPVTWAPFAPDGFRR